MLLPLQGARFMYRGNPGRCPGLGAFGPSARANNDIRSWFPFGRRFSIQSAHANAMAFALWLSLRPPIFNSARANKLRKLCYNNSFPSSISHTQIYRGNNVIIQTQKTGPEGIVFGGRNNSCVNPIRQKSETQKPLKPKWFTRFYFCRFCKIIARKFG